jgi:tripartite-type tricarboxylate transporter receptor subunit TctC
MHSFTVRSTFCRPALSTMAAASFALLALCCARNATAADAFPPASTSTPIKIIVPFQPAGPTDVFARLISQQMTKDWGNPVVVENRAGATGTIGASYVARSNPDGLTMLLTSSSGYLGPYMMNPMPLDSTKDLAPLIMLLKLPFLMIANPGFAPSTLSQVIEAAKKQPGKIAFSSTGIGGGSHLTMEMLEDAAKIKMIHVPYKGSAPEVNAVMAHEVSLSFDTPSTSIGLIKAGKVKPIVITSAKRSPQFPTVPTVVEAGYPGLEKYIWFGIFLPRNTPDAIVDKLHTEITKIMKTANLQARVHDLGAEFVDQSPTDFGKFLLTDTAAWQAIIKKAGVTAAE